MNVTWSVSDENQTYNDEIYDVSDTAVVSALVVIVWTLIANGIIVLCFFIHRKTAWPCFSTQVLFLSVTDIIVGLTSLPLTIRPFISNSINYRQCSLLFLVFYASQCASLYQIFGICVHRCMIINKASRINEQRSNFRFPLALVLSSWILSILANSLLHFLYGSPGATIKRCQFTEIFTGNARSAAKFLFIVYFVPFVLTNVFYLVTCLRLRCIWKEVVPSQVNETEARSTRIPREEPEVQNHIFNVSRDNRLPSVASGSNASNNVSRDNRAGIRTQQKIIRTIGSLMLIFNICTVPLIAKFLIADPNPSQVNRSFNFIVTTLFILNSAINPFVYALRTNWLRLALKKMFRDCFKAICPCKRSE